MRLVPQEETKVSLEFRSNGMHTVHESRSEVYDYIHKETEV
jgi:hypothetical protein